MPNIVNVSLQNAEKVVKPPRKPTSRNSRVCEPKYPLFFSESCDPTDDEAADDVDGHCSIWIPGIIEDPVDPVGEQISQYRA